MSELMSAAGSNKAGSAEFTCSTSGTELISFSASEEEELKEKLNCLPPEMMIRMISWLRGFVSAKKMLYSTVLQNTPIDLGVCKVKEEILLSHKKPLTSMDRLELRFSNNICSPVFTRDNIKGEGCESLHVSLFDSCTGEEIKSGPGSSARVQIVVLDGDGRDWTCKDKRVVGEVEGKNSLLMGNVFLNLINGTGCMPDIYFKSTSRWMKIIPVRLGARLADKSQKIQVKEAMTNSFNVKDWRKKLNQSHDIPSLCDEVWRLHMIGRKGTVNKRLGTENIKTVKDFLDIHFTDANKLQEIFRRKTGAKNLANALSHARTCPDKLLYYPSGLERKTGVVFNVSGEVLGLVLDGKFASSNMLSETEKDLADNTVTYAFKHWGDVIPFEDQKYLVRCSSHLSDPSNASPTDHEYMADINELISDDIPVFNDPFPSSPNYGSEPLTLESMVQNIDEIFISIDAQMPIVKSLPKQQYADIAFSVNSAFKAYKTWKMYAKSNFHLHKKPKLY